MAAGPNISVAGGMDDIYRFGTRNAGCVSVLVGDGHGEEIAEANPDIRLSDLTTLAMMFTTQ